MNVRAALPLLLAIALPALADSTYRVKPGDTVLRLAWEYSISPEAIRRANHLHADDLDAGSYIVLPTSFRRPQPPPPPATPAAPVVLRATPAEQEALPASPLLPVRHWAATPPQSAPAPASDVKDRLLAAARELASHHIAYNEAWTPPGQRAPWRMDCSNTARYLYQTAAGIDLGRTAFDQYDFLRRRRRAWSVPLDGRNLARIDQLRALLKAGDLLFWENTYRPDRSSPITHVMIFLGEDEHGRWIMAGSRGHRAGGPDIYPFDPHQPAGGYSVFFGLIHHTGRFVAFGRPVS